MKLSLYEKFYFRPENNPKISFALEAAKIVATIV